MKGTKGRKAGSKGRRPCFKAGLRPAAFSPRSAFKAGGVEARAGGLPSRPAAFSRPLEIEGRPKAGGVNQKKKKTKRKRKEENERRNE